MAPDARAPAARAPASRPSGKVGTCAERRPRSDDHAGGQSLGGSRRSARCRQARREAAAGAPSGRHRRELDVGSCKCGAAGSCKCGETKPAPRFLGSQSGPSGRLGTKMSTQKKDPLDRVPTALARVSIVFRKRSCCPPLPPAQRRPGSGGLTYCFNRFFKQIWRCSATRDVYAQNPKPKTPLFPSLDSRSRFFLHVFVRGFRAALTL